MKANIKVYKYDDLSWMYEMLEEVPALNKKTGKPNKSAGQLRAYKKKYPGRVQWVVHSLLDQFVDDEDTFTFDVQEKKDIYALADKLQIHMEKVLKEATDKVIDEIRSGGIYFE